MSNEVARSESNSNVITHCTCKIKKKIYDVSLTNYELKWHITGNELKGLQNIRLVDILSASLKKSTRSNTDELCVTYVRQEKRLLLKSCSVTFTSDDFQVILNLHQQISTFVEKNAQRPRRLLVLINPVSGNSKGRSTYEQKVVPIFKEAGIETDVIVTEKAHHTEEILSTYDIKSIDGLVLVGGDGIYHEGVNGLMRRLATEQNINIDDPDETLPVIDIMIGLIPCGTGNGIANASYGNDDVTTAALAIAIGYRSPASMMSVHSDGKLVAYSILLVGHGVWGDLIYTTESRRSQGRMRYPIAILEQMLIKTLRRMQMTIQYENNELQTKQNNIGVDARETNDDHCPGKSTKDSSKEHRRDSHDINRSFKTTTTIQVNAIGSSIFMLSTFPGSSMTAIPDLSKAVMVLNKSSQRTKYMSFMFRLMTLNLEGLETRDDICVLSGQQWKMKLDEPNEPGTRNYEVEHFLNIDGDLFRLSVPEYQAKLLTDRLKLYSNMPYVTKRQMNKT